MNVAGTGHTAGAHIQEIEMNITQGKDHIQEITKLEGTALPTGETVHTAEITIDSEMKDQDRFQDKETGLMREEMYIRETVAETDTIRTEEETIEVHLEMRENQEIQKKGQIEEKIDRQVQVVTDLDIHHGGIHLGMIDTAEVTPDLGLLQTERRN